MKRNFNRYQHKFNKSLEELVKNSDAYSYDGLETSTAIADQIRININWLDMKICDSLYSSRSPKTYHEFIEIRNNYKALKRTMLAFRIFDLPIMLANFNTWDNQRRISTKLYVSKMFFSNYP